MSMLNKQNRIFFSMTLILILFSLMTSCQKTQSYIPVYYNIINNTDSKITVWYNVAITHRGYQEYDSIFRIETGKKMTLLISLNSHYNLGNPEHEDTLQRITAIKIYNNDSIESNKYYQLTKYWKYSEDSSKSDLDLDVYQDDFK